MKDEVFFWQLVAKASITIPKFVKLWLILLAYCNLTPVAPVFSCRSEPAKSTILKVALIYLPLPFSLYLMINTAWLLELFLFMACAPTILIFLPSLNNRYTF